MTDRSMLNQKRSLKVVVILSVLITGCSPEQQLAGYAEDYVQLATSLALYQEGEVDAYFGPASLVSDSRLDFAEIEFAATELASKVSALQLTGSDERQRRLVARLRQLQNIARFLQSPNAFSFGEETGLLYNLPLADLPEETRLDESGRVEIIERPPTTVEIERQAMVAELGELLPGSGSLPFRIARYQARHLVPLDKREAVFARALEECRSKTFAHWSLPAHESLAIQWTRDVSAAWHRYLGDGQSELRINPLTMGYIGSMVDVACHEGYPGHHAQFLLLEAAAPGDGLHPEDQLTLLRSPEAVLREGAADLAVQLAMPWEERLEFEREVLFALAGLSTDDIETYSRIHQLVTALKQSTVPTIQAYSDGDLPRIAAAIRLESDSMVASPNALLEFVDKYQGYSVGYTLAEQHLQNYLETMDGDDWQVLADVLGDPLAMAEIVFSTSE